MRIVIVGAGGHAKVVVASAIAAHNEIVAIVDDDRAKWGRALLGHEISGPCDYVLADPEATCVLAIGDNALRRRIARGARCRFATVIHPSAIVHDTVRIGAGTVVFAGAVIQPDTVIGAHGIVNTSASVDHDCVLGEAVHIAPGARLAGAVTLGDEVFVGIGAVVTPNRTIAGGAIVGAGAAVVTDLASGVAVGIPARLRSSKS